VFDEDCTRHIMFKNTITDFCYMNDEGNLEIIHLLGEEMIDTVELKSKLEENDFFSEGAV